MSPVQNIKIALTCSRKTSLAGDNQERLGGELLKMKQKQLVFINTVRIGRETKLVGRNRVTWSGK